MTTIDPEALIRTGRACVTEGALVRESAGGIDLGASSVPDGAARRVLVARTEQLGARLRHNGRALEALAVEYRDLDGAVSLSLLLLSSEEWR